MLRGGEKIIDTVPEDEQEQNQEEMLDIKARIDEERSIYAGGLHRSYDLEYFNLRIQPQIKTVLEISIKEGLSKIDKQKLIKVLTNVIQGERLPVSILLEIIKKIEPDLSKKSLEIISNKISSQKTFLNDYLEKIKNQQC